MHMHTQHQVINLNLPKRYRGDVLKLSGVMTEHTGKDEKLSRRGERRIEY